MEHIPWTHPVSGFVSLVVTNRTHGTSRDYYDRAGSLLVRGHQEVPGYGQLMYPLVAR